MRQRSHVILKNMPEHIAPLIQISNRPLMGLQEGRCLVWIKRSNLGHANSFFNEAIPTTSWCMPAEYRTAAGQWLPDVDLPTARCTVATQGRSVLISTDVNPPAPFQKLCLKYSAENDRVIFFSQYTLIDIG